ncbi:hypothetical protein HL667_24170 [Bradyrhizobium sp. 83012]|uniref:Uncharacterized protein n=1 Tax=Bradyrhizobium aeschynomenes TaxID=2734909 RepID=A0ABX2CL11_9BRAD|nr:hypothetical protein [Bradyrhizobium aeschynomenes]NPU11031.1 hypothetical protein [Bradyrhizobium aeschynomenes]NPU68120.1 hypothetical protein [Bradyrhizobium aeschynomenes]NPV21686.1 hypothetical protein [Bradyrhizobium aeschynomenes]
MAPINSKRTLRRDLWLAVGLLGLGMLVAIISFTEIKAGHLDQMAQATPSASPEPSATPAEAKPGGTRPTTPAPEPARPDIEAQKEGAKPALPPAPAEKVAPPMDKK